MIEACKRIVELFSYILCGVPVTQINCGGNDFSTLNQNSYILSATKLVKAYNVIQLALYCNDFESQLYTASSCLKILEKSIQKPSEVNCALHIIWLPVLIFTPLALCPDPVFEYTATEEISSEFACQVQDHSLCIPKQCFDSLSPSPFFCPPASRAISHQLRCGSSHWRYFLMPNVSSTKQPLRGACWKKVAISYESTGVALYFFPPRH